MLSGGWVCATVFLERHIPRYGPRIYDLRREGFHIVRRVCQNGWHDHYSTQFEWQIVGLPGESPRLPGFGDPAATRPEGRSGEITQRFSAS